MTPTAPSFSAALPGVSHFRVGDDAFTLGNCSRAQRLWTSSHLLVAVPLKSRRLLGSLLFPPPHLGRHLCLWPQQLFSKKECPGRLYPEEREGGSIDRARERGPGG